MIKRVRQWSMTAVLVIVGAAMMLSQFLLHRSIPTAVSDIGPSSFTKYGYRLTNNPVDLGEAPARFTEHWTYSAGEPLQQASIADGVVYVGGDGGNLSQPEQNRIYAIDAELGRLLWSRKLNNMTMTTPIVGHGLVFVGTGTEQFRGSNLSRENNLQATGIVRGTGPSAIYALEQRTGQIAWKRSTLGEDMPSFVLDRRTLYVVNGAGRLYALRATSGRVLWSLKLGSYVSMASLARVGSDLFVSGAHPYTLYVVNGKTHRVLRRINFPQVFGGSDDSSPAYHHGIVYLEGTEGSWAHPESTLLAVNVRTGRTVFHTTLGSGPLPIDIEVSAPVIHHNIVYIGSPITDSEYAVDAQSGTVLWHFHASGPISESAAVTPHHLYVGDGNGFLYVLNPRDGKEDGSRYFAGAFAADFPLVLGNTLYQPNEDGQMLAIDRHSLLNRTQHGVPNLPLAPGALGEDILGGETVFMNNKFGTGHLTCDSCHLGGGTRMNYQNGHVIPNLLGQASRYPKVSSRHIETLDMQINRCIQRTGASPLNPGDSRLRSLNLYLHWLSSGWNENLNSGDAPANGVGGGCK